MAQIYSDFRYFDREHISHTNLYNKRLNVLHLLAKVQVEWEIDYFLKIGRVGQARSKKNF